MPISKKLQELIESKNDLEQALLANENSNELKELLLLSSPAEYDGSKFGHVTKWENLHVRELGRAAAKSDDLTKINLLSAASHSSYSDYIYHVWIGTINNKNWELMKQIQKKLHNIDFNKLEIFQSSNIEKLNFLEYAINENNEDLAQHAILQLNIKKIDAVKIQSENDEIRKLHENCIKLIRRINIEKEIKTPNETKKESQPSTSLIGALLSLMNKCDKPNSLHTAAREAIYDVLFIKAHGSPDEKTRLEKNQDALIKAIDNLDGKQIIEIAPNLKSSYTRVKQGLVSVGVLLLFPGMLLTFACPLVGAIIAGAGLALLFTAFILQSLDRQRQIHQTFDNLRNNSLFKTSNSPVTDSSKETPLSERKSTAERKNG